MRWLVVSELFLACAHEWQARDAIGTAPPDQCLASPRLSRTAAGGEGSRCDRDAVRRLALSKDDNADVRLTGPVPIAHEEFATLQDGALLNGALTAAIVLLILWLALQSLRIVAAVVGGGCATRGRHNRRRLCIRRRTSC